MQENLLDEGLLLVAPGEASGRARRNAAPGDVTFAWLDGALNDIGRRIIEREVTAEPSVAHGHDNFANRAGIAGRQGRSQQRVHGSMAANQHGGSEQRDKEGKDDDRAAGCDAVFVKLWSFARRRSRLGVARLCKQHCRSRIWPPLPAHFATELQNR
jgi:hypothetical protein